MTSELEKFTEFLYGNNSGWIYSPVKKANLDWVQEWFSWPIQKEKLHDWIRTNALESDVYIAPVLFADKKVSKASVKKSNVVWVEFDGQTQIEFKDLPLPDYTIQTSTDTHKHLYWKLQGEYTNEAVEETNRRLTYYLSADSSGWDITQVLRPPETTNFAINKSQPVLSVKVIHDNIITKHSLDEFDLAPEIPKPVFDIEYSSLLPIETVLGKIKFDIELVNRVKREIPIEDKKRSTFMVSTAYLLAEAGLNHLEITTALYEIDHRLKKYVGRQDQLIRLSEIASQVLLKIKIAQDNKYSVEIFSPLEILNSVDAHKYILGNWLHDTGILLLTGAPGVGKSQVAFQMGYALSTGTSFLNKAFIAPMKVAILSYEMDKVGLKYIFEHQTKAFIEQKLWNENLTAVPLEDYEFEVMEAIISKLKPDVIIIDSLSEMTDTMKDDIARDFMKKLRKIRQKYNCAIIMITHNRKESGTNKKAVKLSDLYGSYIWAAKSDSVITLWQDENKPDSMIEGYPVKTRYDRRVPFFMKRTEHLTFIAQDVILPEKQKTEASKVNPLLEFS